MVSKTKHGNEKGRASYVRAPTHLEMAGDSLMKTAIHSIADAKPAAAIGVMRARM